MYNSSPAQLANLRPIPPELRYVKQKGDFHIATRIFNKLTKILKENGETQFDESVQAIIDKAKDGDYKALEMLLEWSFGKLPTKSENEFKQVNEFSSEAERRESILARMEQLRKGEIKTIEIANTILHEQ